MLPSEFISPVLHFSSPLVHTPSSLREVLYQYRYDNDGTDYYDEETNEKF